MLSSHAFPTRLPETDEIETRICLSHMVFELDGHKDGGRVAGRCAAMVATPMRRTSAIALREVVGEVVGEREETVTARPSAAPTRGDGPQRIVRSERLRLASLDPSERSAVIDQLYRIYSETVQGDTREQFEAQVFGGGEVRVALFYGTCDELAGFTFAGIARMDHGGRNYAVFCAGVFFRLGYQGGKWSALFGLREALRFKLREPRTPLAYCTRSSSPAVYRLLASTMPEIYPSRHCETPAEIESVVRAFTARRKYVAVGEGPWVVKSGARPRNAARMRRIISDPEARFYTELNPHYAERNALVVWIPLGPRNIVGGLLRLLRGRLAR
jgi:hypothetical protein